jgi:glycosyltransferase involved in cell wall biosynthesis
VHVTCVGKRFHHHTASGGYDRLAAAVGAKLVVRKEVHGLVGTVANTIWSRLTPTKDYFIDYQLGDYLVELQALATGLLRPPDILHVLYNSSLDLLIRRRPLLRCPLVVTFHAPFKHNVAHRFDAYPKGLGIDIAVVVATNQILPMQRWIEPHRIFCIPHGIDTDRFLPADHISEPKMRALIVGEHMRDWFVIHKAIDEINYRGLDIEFHVVTHERFFPYFNGCANVIYHSRISEAHLIDLYRSADVLFLPVTDATANNSILEALACGTPVISTQVGGIPDYVDVESGWLLPVGDVRGHVNLITSLHANRDLARARRHAARTQALKFDWHKIAEQMIALYAAAKNGTWSLGTGIVDQRAL